MTTRERAIAIIEAETGGTFDVLRYRWLVDNVQRKLECEDCGGFDLATAVCTDSKAVTDVG